MKNTVNLPKQAIVAKDAHNSQEIMRSLRHFHLGNPTALEQLESFDESLLPALLAPYRDTTHLRYDYPLYLAPIAESDISSVEVKKLAVRLSDYLVGLIESFAPNPKQSRILKDNLPWLERDLRQRAEQFEGPIRFSPLFDDAIGALSDKLKLRADAQVQFQADCEKLANKLDDQGHILAYGRFPALHLLMYLIRNQVLPHIQLFKNNLDDSIRELKKLLKIDDSKKKQASSSDMLERNLKSKQLFNTQSLSKVVKHSHGALAMSDKRRARIEQSLQVMQRFKQEETLVHIVYSSPSLNEYLNKEHDFIADSNEFICEQAKDPCLKAREIFEHNAVELAKVFAAVRIARLEINNAYDETIHDPWFEQFNWEVFSKEELILVPSVIVLESANTLVSESMNSFSQLLSSGRPVHVFVRVLAHNNPGAREGEEPFQNYRTELGYLGISHRQAVVTQSSAARHEHLLEQFNIALKATRTSLHLINVGLREAGNANGLNAWLVAGAALEGRAHPFFLVNPIEGDSAADRMHFEGNPQPEKDWPVQQFSFINEAGEHTEMELAFTFADYALLIPGLQNHFALVPTECNDQSLIPVAEYIEMSKTQLDSRELDKFVPYIWAINQENDLRMVVVSRALVCACRDRLNYWHTLQEMAGIKNRYIEQAKQQIQQEAEQTIKEAIEKAQQDFDLQLKTLKTEAAAEVMSKLADALLNTDMGQFANIANAKTSSSVSPESAKSTEQEAEVVEQVVEQVEQTEEILSDPWIDSPLCTTCNDCININPIMFQYDDSKQAFITDTASGTYAQMVEAAEVCPSKCIHPGAPWDNTETNLDELLERAKPFQ